MQVKNILHIKGETVVTVRPETAIQELARILAAKGIGVAMVTTVHGAIIGIASERDIAKGVARHGSKITELTVADVMVREVVSCSRENTLGDILLLMSANEIRHLPVVENDRLAGIISMRDVVDCRLSELETENENLKQMLSDAA